MDHFVVLKTGLEQTLTSQEIAVMYLMACHASSFKFHSRWLGEKLSMSKPTVLKVLSSLREKGFVVLHSSKEKGKFKESYFTLIRTKVVHNETIGGRKTRATAYNEDELGSPF